MSDLKLVGVNGFGSHSSRLSPVPHFSQMTFACRAVKSHLPSRLVQTFM